LKFVKSENVIKGADSRLLGENTMRQQLHIQCMSGRRLNSDHQKEHPAFLVSPS